MTNHVKLKNKRCSLCCTNVALRGRYRTLMLIETCEHWNRLFVCECVFECGCECGCVFSEANINFVQSTLLFLNYDAQMSAELMYLSAILFWTSNSLQEHKWLIPSGPTSGVAKGSFRCRIGYSSGCGWETLMGAGEDSWCWVAKAQTRAQRRVNNERTVIRNMTPNRW